MDITPKAKFNFVKYIVENASINISEDTIGNDLKAIISPKGLFDKDKNIFIMTLSVIITDANNHFNLNLDLKSWFKYQADDTETLKNFIGQNAPAIVFPYIRAYVSTITAMSGMQPVIMPTLNMTNVGRQLVDSLDI